MMELKKEDYRIYAHDENDNLLAEITFPPVTKDKVVINHTYVAPQLRNQGIADSLCHAAADTIRENNLKCVASCPYAIRWFDEHPDECDILG